MDRANAGGVGWLWFATAMALACGLFAGCKDRRGEKFGQLAAPAAIIHSSLPRGPSEAQLQKLYHLAEGSEFVPYCMLKVLAKENKETVSQFFERYHLIPDGKSETNPLGLPIGVTVKDGMLKEVGFNCAACHVSRIPGVAGNVVGGPSDFDIRGFYDELIPRLTAMQKDLRQWRQVLGCMALGSKSDAEVAPAAAQVTQELDASLEQQMESGSHSELFKHLDEASNKPAAATGDVARATEQAELASPALRALPAEKKHSFIKAWVGKFKERKAFLAAKLNALKIVASVGACTDRYTAPGPGRVDAFMTALNLMDPEILKKECNARLPMDSPVAFPHLWALSTVTYRHWDNNTNATLQRNMGQAIGVGAVIYDRQDVLRSLGSNLIVPALIELESIVTTIQPPPWPFANDDAKLVASGKKLYDDNCAGCHEPKNGRIPLSTEDPGTDRNRLDNFSREVDGKKPIELLKTKLAAVELGSNAKPKDRDVDPRWEATGRYGARTLQGVWATAPYLHNNSVPTLADLLSAPAERPVRFRLDYSRYDTERVGFPVLSAAMKNQNPFEFDTTKPGNGNGGHLYGTALGAEEKKSLLAYLKQL